MEIIITVDAAVALARPQRREEGRRELQAARYRRRGDGRCRGGGDGRERVIPRRLLQPFEGCSHDVF